MGQNLLNKVFETEGEISKRISSEDEKAEAWLQDIRTQAENELAPIRAELESSFALAMKEAESRAKEKASRIIRLAQDEAAIFQKLDPAQIKNMITAYIPKILY